VFSSACIATRKPILASRVAETLRPRCKKKIEVNAIGEDGEKRKMPSSVRADREDEVEKNDENSNGYKPEKSRARGDQRGSSEKEKVYGSRRER